jgi:two-component sensor histidine kinase
MGLKLVRNLVQQQLKGDIHVKRDKGTEFIVEFKLEKAEEKRNG